MLNSNPNAKIGIYLVLGIIVGVLVILLIKRFRNKETLILDTIGAGADSHRHPVMIPRNVQLIRQKMMEKINTYWGVAWIRSEDHKTPVKLEPNVMIFPHEIQAIYFFKKLENFKQAFDNPYQNYCVLIDNKGKVINYTAARFSFTHQRNYTIVPNPYDTHSVRQFGSKNSTSNVTCCVRSDPNDWAGSCNYNKKPLCGPPKRIDKDNRNFEAWSNFDKYYKDRGYKGMTPRGSRQIEAGTVQWQSLQRCVDRFKLRIYKEIPRIKKITKIPIYHWEEDLPSCGTYTKSRCNTAHSPTGLSSKDWPMRCLWVGWPTNKCRTQIGNKYDKLITNKAGLKAFTEGIGHGLVEAGEDAWEGGKAVFNEGWIHGGRSMKHLFEGDVEAAYEEVGKGAKDAWKDTKNAVIKTFETTGNNNNDEEAEENDYDKEASANPRGPSEEEYEEEAYEEEEKKSCDDGYYGDNCKYNVIEHKPSNTDKTHCPDKYEVIINKDECRAAAKAINPDANDPINRSKHRHARSWSKYCSMRKNKVIYGGDDTKVNARKNLRYGYNYLCKKTPPFSGPIKLSDSEGKCPENYITISDPDKCNDASKSYFKEDRYFIDAMGSRSGAAKHWGKNCQTAGYEGGGGDCEERECDESERIMASEEASGARMGGSHKEDLPEPYRYLCEPTNK